jgi:hypothetical protein
MRRCDHDQKAGAHSHERTTAAEPLSAVILWFRRGRNPQGSKVCWTGGWTSVCVLIHEETRPSFRGNSHAQGVARLVTSLLGLHISMVAGMLFTQEASSELFQSPIATAVRRAGSKAPPQPSSSTCGTRFRAAKQRAGGWVFRWSAGQPYSSSGVVGWPKLTCSVGTEHFGLILACLRQNRNSGGCAAASVQVLWSSQIHFDA